VPTEGVSVPIRGLNLFLLLRAFVSSWWKEISIIYAIACTIGGTCPSPVRNPHYLSAAYPPLAGRWDPRVILHRYPHRLRNHFPDSNQHSSTKTKNKTIYSTLLYSTLLYSTLLYSSLMPSLPPFTLHNNPFTISHTYLAASPAKKSVPTCPRIVRDQSWIRNPKKKNPCKLVPTEGVSVKIRG